MPQSTRTRITSYRDLDVWQLAMDIVIEIYRVTAAFPAEEKFGLTAQLRRAAVSIPSNIAEGYNRLGGAEFRRFVSIARGSVAEVETQVAVAMALGFTDDEEIKSLSSQLDRLSKMLFGLHRRLARQRPPPVVRRRRPSSVVRLRSRAGAPVFLRLSFAAPPPRPDGAGGRATRRCAGTRTRTDATRGRYAPGASTGRPRRRSQPRGARRASPVCRRGVTGC